MSPEMVTLVNSCFEYAGNQDYPLNLDKRRHLQSTLEEYHRLLRQHGPRIFNGSQSDLHLLEAYRGENDHHSWRTIGGVQELRQAFGLGSSQQEREPLSRHVFISAPNSRAHLRCTSDMFQVLGTYFQVPPEFLGLLFSFGEQQDQQDFNQTYFHGTYFPKAKMPHGGLIPELERSGWELKLNYKLHALEKAGDEWVLRQTALHHSFDLLHGKAFWISVKANKEIRERVRKETGQGQPLEAATAQNCSSAFEATLRIHLINMEWASEGWRWFIHDAEKNLRKLFLKAKAAPIKSAKNASRVEKDITRGASFYSQQQQTKKTPTLLSTTAKRTWSGLTAVSQRLSFFEKVPQPTVGVSPFTMPTTTTTTTTRDLRINDETGSGSDEDNTLPHEELIAQVTKDLDTLRDFDIHGVQRLNDWSSKLHEYKLAISLNIKNMVDLRDFYQRLSEYPDFPDDMKALCGGFFGAFQSRMKFLERSLEGECLRMDALITLVEENRQLHDQILQFRTSQVNLMYAKNSQVLSHGMADMAKKTERDTMSMHIITLFTLIFLPGIFLGTFFSTPIFSSDNATSWGVNHGLILLFFEICIPMMIMTIAVWALYMRVKRRPKQSLALKGAEAV